MSEKDYIPYGPEWEAEMMYWNKKDLISLLRNTLKKEVQSGDQLHSLRLAVLELFNSKPAYWNYIIENKDYAIKEDYDKTMISLALSAGIHFVNGQWKLKEDKGEEK